MNKNTHGAAAFQSSEFAFTGLSLAFMDGDQDERQIYIPSAQAMAWDGALEGANCAIRSNRYEVMTYAKIVIQKRSKAHWFRFWGFGYRAQVTFMEEGGSGDTFQCLVLDPPK